MSKRHEIIDEAKRWLGAQWHHEACARYQAADCGQILIDIYAQCGLIYRPIVEHYSRDWALHRDEERYLAIVEQYAHQVDCPKMGDIAVWRIGRSFSHGAIVVDWPQIIHADVHAGVVYAEADSGELSEKEVRFYSVFSGQD